MGRRRAADQREADRHDVVGQPEELGEDPLLIGVADERAGQALVDRGQEHEHHQRAGVDEPVRHGPGDLDTARRGELVGLVVARVVERLVRRDDEVNRRVARRIARVELVLVGERVGELPRASGRR